MDWLQAHQIVPDFLEKAADRGGGGGGGGKRFGGRDARAVSLLGLLLHILH